MTERGDGQDTSYDKGEYEIKILKKTLYSYAAPIKDKLPTDYFVQADARVSSGAKGIMAWYSTCRTGICCTICSWWIRATPYCMWKVRGGQIQTVVDWTPPAI